MRVYFWPLTPVPKPRQTQRDKWAKRPAVVRYRDFADEVRRLANEQKFVMPESGAALLFTLPMPASWSEKKRDQHYHKPHRQKPDLDNLVKAFLDALCEDDCAIWQLRGVSKVWGDKGGIVVDVVSA